MTSLSWTKSEDGGEWSTHKNRVLVTWPIGPGLLSHGWAVIEMDTLRDVARGQSGNRERARFTAGYAAENRKAEIVARPRPQQASTRTTPNPYSRKGKEAEERWWSRPSPSSNGNWHVGTREAERIIVVRGGTSDEAEALAVRVRDLLNGEKP